MTQDEIDCYRTDYSKKWIEYFNKDPFIPFPLPGAIRAINELCDEVERLRKELRRLKEK